MRANQRTESDTSVAPRSSDLPEGEAALAGQAQFIEMENRSLATIESVTGEDELLISVMAMSNRNLTRPAANERYVDVKRPSKGRILDAVVAQVIDVVGNKKIKALVINTHGGPGFFQWHLDDPKGGDDDFFENVKPLDTHALAKLAPYFTTNGELVVSGCGSGSGRGGFDLGKAIATHLPGVTVFLTANSYNQVESRGDRPGADAFRETPSGPAVSYKTYQFRSTNKRLDVTHNWRNDHKENRWASEAYFQLYDALHTIAWYSDASDKDRAGLDVASILQTCQGIEGAMVLLDIFRVPDLSSLVACFSRSTAAGPARDLPLGAFASELNIAFSSAAKLGDAGMVKRIANNLRTLQAEVSAFLTDNRATIHNNIESALIVDDNESSSTKEKATKN